jgi:hypothetical protein
MAVDGGNNARPTRTETSTAPFKCHAGCNPSDIMAALRRDRRWRDIREPRREEAEPKRSAEDTRRYLLSIWRECRLISGTPAERYFAAAASRSICRRACDFTPRSSTPTSAGFSRACERKRAVAACAAASVPPLRSSSTPARRVGGPRS